MAFEAYSVAIKLSLINGVTYGLLLISKGLQGANVSAEEFQGRLTKIGKQMAVGGALVGAGAAIAAPFIFAIDRAAELQKQMLGIQVAARGTTSQMVDMRHAIEGVASQTVFSNIDVAKMGKLVATGTGLAAPDVTKLLPEYAKFADVQYLMKGTDYNQSVTDAIRLAHTAQHYDPASLGKYLDLLTKASFVVPGGLNEVGNALKYSQGMGKTALGIGDEQMVLMTALLNRLGFAGSRGGTNLIAAMSRTIPGVFGSGLLAGKSGEALKRMGFTDPQGHSTIFTDGKFDTFKWMGHLSDYVSREFASHPEAIARQDIMKNFQYAFGVQGSRVASLLSSPQAISQLKMLGQTFSGYGGVDSIQSMFANQSAEQKYMNAKTNFVSAMTELGYTLLPLATVALTKLNAKMQTMISWMSANPDAVKKIAEGFLILSGVLITGGLITMIAAACSGFALLGLLIGGISLPFALFLGAVTALTLGVRYLYQNWSTIWPQIKSGFVAFGSWIINFFSNLWGSVENFFGGGAKKTTFVPKSLAGTVHLHTAVNIDGKKVAQAVSVHQGRWANIPRSGGGLDGGLAMPMPGVR